MVSIILTCLCIVRIPLCEKFSSKNSVQFYLCSWLFLFYFLVDIANALVLWLPHCARIAVVHFVLPIFVGVLV